MEKPTVTLEPVAFADKYVLRNLMGLYLHDFSEMVGIPVSPHGTFQYGMLDHYWTDKGRHPFLIRVDGAVAGFVMVTEGIGDEKATDMSEFFVLRGHRRSGVGREAALLAFKAFPGPWRVSEIAENPVAQGFWRRVIGEFTNGGFTEEWTDDGNRKRLVQSFVSGETNP